MKELNLFSKIINGKLEVLNKENLSKWIKQQPEGSDIVIKVKNQDNYYSSRQLRLIYHQFRQISEKIGHSVEDVKTILKMKYGFCYNHEIEGETICNCKSISEFNRKELSDFIVNIDIWSNQNLGLQLLNYDDLQFLKT